MSYNFIKCVLGVNSEPKKYMVREMKESHRKYSHNNNFVLFTGNPT